ncbi:MAG: hypothetical protein WA208_13655 [Thermoanaerobaculia bacterium]
MAAAIIEVGEVSAAALRAGVDGLTVGQSQQAVDTAVDQVRQAALNAYTSASFEALTVATAPDEMRKHCLALALGNATSTDAGRPESIQRAYDEARQWLSFLASGKTHYDKLGDAVLEVAEASAAEVTYSRRSSRVISSDNDAWVNRSTEI